MPSHISKFPVFVFSIYLLHTIDHSILVHRLSSWFGISGNALNWFSSYLSHHSFTVSIDSHLSSIFPLSCGVPQGSVLGRMLFNLHTIYSTQYSNFSVFTLPPFAVIFNIISKIYIAHIPDGKINRQMESEAHKDVITKVYNQSKMLKGKLEIVRFESASKDRDRWCSSNVIRQAVPYCRCGTLKGAWSNFRMGWTRFELPVVGWRS